MPTVPPPLDPFASLNAQQRDAVEHGIDQPDRQGEALLVIAGAGSGKTMTLASRVAKLVLAGADPQRILLLTFSRHAAKEMETCPSFVANGRQPSATCSRSWLTAFGYTAWQPCCAMRSVTHAYKSRQACCSKASSRGGSATVPT